MAKVELMSINYRAIKTISCVSLNIGAWNCNNLHCNFCTVKSNVSLIKRKEICDYEYKLSFWSRNTSILKLSFIFWFYASIMLWFTVILYFCLSSICAYYPHPLILLCFWRKTGHLMFVNECICLSIQSQAQNLCMPANVWLKNLPILKVKDTDLDIF